MTDDEDDRLSAFEGSTLLAHGSAAEVFGVVLRHLARSPESMVLFFEGGSGRQVDFDLRGTLAEVLARVAPREARSPGRPKLGVVSREVSLLPRHWAWLESQPHGLSGTLRRLVDEARRADAGDGLVRRRREAAGRFMSAMAGDLAGYEEASRALYAGDGARLGALMASWPRDVAAEVWRLVGGAMGA
ncbi:MAG: DUF2239 family protein [Myxococcales bacterium]|nr:DUF2239 family protein [Myxococcales bacterium]